MNKQIYIVDLVMQLIQKWASTNLHDIGFIKTICQFFKEVVHSWNSMVMFYNRS